MSKLRLHGTSSGYTDIAPTAAAGNNTLTAPTGTGTLAHVSTAGVLDINNGAGQSHFEISQSSGNTVKFGIVSGSDIELSGSSNNSMYFKTNNTERLRIAAGGNVGVGDASPGNLLTVAGRTETQSITGHEGTNTDLQIASGHASSNIVFNIGQFGVSATEKLRIDSSGHVNISGITTAKTFVPSEGQLSHRNLIINGAMQVAQRGTSSSSDGYHTVDRFKLGYGGENETPTQYQGALTSSDTGPWEAGFRQSYYVTNGNQTGGAGTSDYIEFQYKVEARDIANSGWDYTSSSSYITLSFWVKSSVAQNFYGFVYSADGTPQRYIWETGTLTANQWKKVIVKIPGGTNVQFDDNTGEGMIIKWIPFYGTDKTNSSVGTLGAWANYNGSARCPDYTSTWWTTDNATFRITGVQLEVGSSATPFEHKSYDEEFKRCQRYYQDWQDYTHWANRGPDNNYDGHIIIDTLRIDMRANPTITKEVYGRIANASAWVNGDSGNEAAALHNDPSSDYPGRYVKLTGAWSWDSSSQDTIAIKFISCKMDAEL